jgi:sulfur carrier protein ThiS
MLAGIHKEGFLEEMGYRTHWDPWMIFVYENVCVLRNRVVIKEEFWQQEHLRGGQKTEVFVYLIISLQKKLKIHFIFMWYGIVWGYLIFF